MFGASDIQHTDAFLVLSNGDSIENEHISIIIFQSSHFPSPSMSLYLYKTTSWELSFVSLGVLHQI